MTADPAMLQNLRQRIARLERAGAGDIPHRPSRRVGSAIQDDLLTFGLDALDGHLPWGGLPADCMHEIVDGDSGTMVAAGGGATAFAAALAGRQQRRHGGPVVWIAPRHSAHESLYRHGLAAFGLDPDALLVVRIPGSGRNAATRTLWALEETLRERAVALACAEIDTLDLAASRRLQLAAAAGGTTGLLLRSGAGLRTGLPPTASVTRWRITSAPSIDLSVPRWRVELLRARNGRPRRWLLEWRHDLNLSPDLSLNSVSPDTVMPDAAPDRANRRRLVSLWLPRFATDRICRRNTTAPTAAAHGTPPEQLTPERGRPLVTVALDGSRGLRIEAVDAIAAAAGLTPGQSLADARALEPGVIVHDAQPAADLAVLAELAGWARRYTPWTAASGLEPCGSAGLWLDISGCAHLFGGEEELLDDLTRRLRTQGYAVRAGLADSTGAAWAAARFGEGHDARPFVIVPPDGQRALLEALPVTALRLPPATVEALARLGLRRICDLLRLPRDGLATRFGTPVTQRLDQAFGTAAEPISPRLPDPSWRVAMNFAEPLGHTAAIATAVGRLTEALCARLSEAGRGARRLELALFRTAGRVDHVTTGTSRPNREPAHLIRLIGEQLDRLPETPDGPYGNAETAIDYLTLTATVTEPLTAAQTSLPGEYSDNGATCTSQDAADLGTLVDRLTNRLGPDAVIRLDARQSHIPEHAQRAAPALVAIPATPRPKALPPRPAQPRPPRLLPRPEPIEATAPVPDDPPLLFRRMGQTGGRSRGKNGVSGGGRLHRIVRAEGPERLAPEWWCGASPNGGGNESAATRDYYRVEDSDGRRFWLYREGLYNGDAEAPPPRWYLHGFFG